MRFLSVLIAIFIIAPSPAMAIRKIEKKPKQQSTSAKKTDQRQKQVSGEERVSPDQSKAPDKKSDLKRREREDRFIDENSDGINDRIDKRQTVKVKKREASKREARKAAPPKKEPSKKQEKKSRRDR
ncbi:MAG: hypothetical protein V3W18_06935 [candidate division Zixibacteria bacterium]